MLLYSTRVPARTNRPAMLETASMVMYIGGAGRPPSLFPDEVASTEQEPGAAVPVLVELEFWEPEPFRPGPVPAPSFMYCMDC